MEASPLILCVLVALCHEASGFVIRNKLLGKCLQVQAGPAGVGRVSLGECSLNSPIQQWRWLSESQVLYNQHTGECLAAPGEQFEGVRLQPCIAGAEAEETGEGRMVMDGEAGSQIWSCSKKGHLTLLGKGLHLSATKESTLVFLSKEHKQGSRWRTLENQTVCGERDGNRHQHHYHPHHHLGKSLALPSAISSIHGQPQQIEVGFNTTEKDTVTELSPLSINTKSPADPTMVFFSMDYGMGWKITMLVLSSLALVLGTVILILNVYSNRTKKVVCVLKSYTPREGVSLPGSPAPNERAPLTKHAMSLPHSSPSLRGEILIEWKDGTVTPLYEG
ncbi:uncharacterized protein ACJ7VT_009353 [Polymixia lowei]